MQDISRRDFNRLLALAGAAVVAAERGLGPAVADDRFIMASTGGSWGDSLADCFVKRPGFEAKNNVTVTYAHQLESVATSKVLGATNDVPFSVTSHSPPDAVQMAAAGKLQSYDPALVSNYADIRPSACLPAGYGLDGWFASINVSIFALTWNTKLAKKPTSWQDLWKNEYKGKIAVPAYGWYGMHWLNALNRSLGGTEADVGPAIQAVSDLVRKNGAHICQNADHGMRLLQSEEVVMMPYMNGRTYALQDGGTPVEIEVVPGAYQGGTGFVIPKETRFRELANKLVNNTLAPDLQVELTRRLKYGPSNTKAVITPDIARYVTPDSAFEKLVALDWKAITDRRAANLERWNREVI